MNTLTRIAGIATTGMAALLLTACGGGTPTSVVPAASSAPDVTASAAPAPAVAAPAADAPAAAAAAVVVAPGPAVAQPAPVPGQPAPTETTRQTLAAGIKTVTISDASGNVAVTGADTDRVALVRHVYANPTRPPETIKTTGPDLRIDAPHCAADDWPRVCRIDYELQVPRGTVVTLTSASGDLTLAGLTGQQSAVSASGSVTIKSAAGPITARSTSGDVQVQATAVVQSLVATSVSGNASVVVPPGRYRLDTATTSGDRDVTLANDPAGSALVQVTTVSGDLSLGTVAHSDSD